jgi:hypothetical protein
MIYTVQCTMYNKTVHGPAKNINPAGKMLAMHDAEKCRHF